MGMSQIDVSGQVLVVGSGSSGWDIAYDLAKNDSKVTFLQRSPCYVFVGAALPSSG
jgi:cation diffusion facilitator CzcD-associated flavoprotein CzcO